MTKPITILLFCKKTGGRRNSFNITTMMKKKLHLKKKLLFFISLSLSVSYKTMDFKEVKLP